MRAYEDENQKYPALRLRKVTMDKLNQLAEMLGDRRTKVLEQMIDVYLEAAPLIVAEQKKMTDALTKAIVDQRRTF